MRRFVTVGATKFYIDLESEIDSAMVALNQAKRNFAVIYVEGILPDGKCSVHETNDILIRRD